MNGAPYSHLLTLDRVLELYALGITRFKGTGGPPQSGCVEGSLGSAWTAEIYRSQTDDPDSRPGLLFAAYVFVYLAKNHCFPDGNKRVAWLSLVDVLAMLKLTLRASDDEAYDFVIAVVKGERSTDDVVTWLASRLEAASDMGQS